MAKQRYSSHFRSEVTGVWLTYLAGARAKAGMGSNQSINQSINQSTNQPTNQSISQPINPSVNEVTVHAIEHQPVDVSLQQLVKPGAVAAVATAEGCQDA